MATKIINKKFVSAQIIRRRVALAVVLFSMILFSSPSSFSQPECCPESCKTDREATLIYCQLSGFCNVASRTLQEPGLEHCTCYYCTDIGCTPEDITCDEVCTQIGGRWESKGGLTYYENYNIVKNYCTSADGYCHDVVEGRIKSEISGLSCLCLYCHKCNFFSVTCGDCSEGCDKEICGDECIQELTEDCEKPSTSNNIHCPQPTQQCSGNKLGTRDARGNCDSECHCVYDNFAYSCVKGSCNAECDSDDDCNDGRSYTIDKCNLATCKCTHDEQPHCNNGVVDAGEDCERPDTRNNQYCQQQSATCQSAKTGKRDGLGNCDANCGCVYDSFSYSCVKGSCNAECDSDDHCDDGNTHTIDSCDMESCSCVNQQEPYDREVYCNPQYKRYLLHSGEQLKVELDEIFDLSGNYGVVTGVLEDSSPNVEVGFESPNFLLLQSEQLSEVETIHLRLDTSSSAASELCSIDVYDLGSKCDKLACAQCISDEDYECMSSNNCFDADIRVYNTGATIQPGKSVPHSAPTPSTISSLSTFSWDRFEIDPSSGDLLQIFTVNGQAVEHGIESSAVAEINFLGYKNNPGRICTELQRMHFNIPDDIHDPDTELLVPNSRTVAGSYSGLGPYLFTAKVWLKK
ncbi:hypothetical protein KY320_02520 [Candidatus Woesearchaeota archaeon]|nr:hypothetical protein [Candidatus Woesearchaeota archaeon]